MRRVLLALILAAPCSSEVRAAAPPPVVLELASTVLRGEDLVTPIYGTGILAPQKMTNVSLLADGVIEKVHVMVGDRAEAENARRNLDRVKALATRNVVSADRLDDAWANEDILSARLTQTRTFAGITGRQELIGTIEGIPRHHIVVPSFHQSEVDIVVDGRVDELLWKQVPYYDNMLV